MISINKLFLLLIIIFLISCRTQIKYITIPLSTPPDKYYISDYTTKKELYFEYQHALMTIKEWQLWYNLNARTNYFNYKDITNMNDLKIDFDTTNLIITNNIITNELLSETNEIRNK